MGCYLCAYQATQQPKRPSPLPAGSPASPTDSLGTCGQCSVLACSGHGTRYGQFFCAMCRASAAIAGVVTPSASGGAGSAATHAAMAAARRVGERAGPNRQQRVGAALIRIARDAVSERDMAERFVAPEPNLVWDLAGAIEGVLGEPAGTVPAVRDAGRARLLKEAPGPVEISLDAVAGGVRGLFAGAPPADVSRDGVIVVTGALVIAVTVADDPDAADRGGSDVVDPSKVEIPPPWEMSHPILLGLPAWLVATAYHLA